VVSFVAIRELTKTDLPVIIQLINELASSLNEDFTITYDEVEKHYLEMIKNTDIYLNYVYCVDNAVVAFCSLLLYRSFFHHNGTAQINELIVSKEFRNKGIGKALLEHCICISKQRDMDEIEVGVMPGNKKAQNSIKVLELMKNISY